MVFAENIAHFTHGMAFMSFVLAAVFLKMTKKGGRLSTFLFWEMIFWAFIQFKDLTYLIPGYWENEYFSNIHLSIDNWCVPITMLFFFEIVSPKWVTCKKAVIITLPSVLLTVLYVITRSKPIFNAGLVYSLVLGLAALIIVYMASARYDNFVKRNFSYLENISLKWMRSVILLLFLLLVMWTVATVFSTWLSDALYYPFAIAIWSIIYYRTVKHEVIIVPDYINPLSSETPEPMSENGNGNKFNFAAKLEQAMTEEKCYLDPKLSLADLARMIGTNRSYLSEYINNNLGLNFYEYVNSFRIREAKRMLDEDKEGKFTQEYMAEECGFHSLSTFKRSFMKETGVTPGKYRKKV